MIEEVVLDKVNSNKVLKIKHPKKYKLVVTENFQRTEGFDGPTIYGKPVKHRSTVEEFAKKEHLINEFNEKIENLFKEIFENTCSTSTIVESNNTTEQNKNTDMTSATSNVEISKTCSFTSEDNGLGTIGLAELFEYCN
ncbi:MAG: hypothetical protein K0R02_11 [Rickettsiaceae bacterium]|jgi:hypothetical protein|nr:hypothetical protein [Rickettsiaceae bacterium]